MPAAGNSSWESQLCIFCSCLNSGYFSSGLSWSIVWFTTIHIRELAILILILKKISKRKFALFILVLLVLDKLSPLFLCHVVDSVDQMIPIFQFVCSQNRRNNARIHKTVAIFDNILPNPLDWQSSTNYCLLSGLLFGRSCWHSWSLFKQLCSVHCNIPW